MQVERPALLSFLCRRDYCRSAFFLSFSFCFVKRMPTFVMHAGVVTQLELLIIGFADVGHTVCVYIDRK